MGFLKKALTLSALTAGGLYGAAYFFFPEVHHNQFQLYKAVERGTRLGVTGMKMIYYYLVSGLDSHEQHMRSARVLCDAFKKNGGVYLKFGQIIASIDVLAPIEYVETLSELFQSCPKSSKENIIHMFESSTNQKIEDVFTEFNWEPINSASIAQVHEARLKGTGERVAVKIQHRWLKEQCEGDVRLLCHMINLGEYLFPEFKYKWLGVEMKQNVPKELDFVQEAANANRIRELFKNDKMIKIPKIYEKHSNDKVLVMEFVEGVPINQVNKIKEMGLSMSEVAHILSKNFTEQIFTYGFVHSDPHPGNIFVNKQMDKNGKPTGKPLLILLDHGLYKELPEETRIAYSYLWKGILTQDEEMMKDASRRLGVTELYSLLVTMVTTRAYSEVMNKDEMDTKKRLKPTLNNQRKKTAQENFRKLLKEILFVLHSINNDVLLLFKTNNFINTLDNQLGSPIDNYELMAKYCFEAVEKDIKKHKKLTLLDRIRMTLQWIRLYIGLKIQKLLMKLFPEKAAVLSP